MVEFEKPKRCPSCGVERYRDENKKLHTAVNYLYSNVSGDSHKIYHAENKVGFICSNCGFNEIKYTGREKNARI